jgi:hypothetical protein
MRQAKAIRVVGHQLPDLRVIIQNCHCKCKSENSNRPGDFDLLVDVKTQDFLINHKMVKRYSESDFR